MRTKIEPLELKYLLIELTHHLSAIITKDQLSTVIELYFRGISNKKVQLRNFTIYIEKCGIIFYNLKNFSLKGKLKNQTPPSSDFKAFWKGNLASIRKESLPFFIRKMHGSIKCPQVLNTDDFLWSLEAKD